ncbi:hypothetical protein CAPTEDRAFT_186823 [Capitella teleta]|uniref:Apple domain-containing protein n=1 Tax=Capitella teleta TaxID=283909 RepID=R7UD16_CAPTE|nr:hypothetical protein CAPTEDRAFT_186823 [Capitella teleta]|eukprot:ELU03971.1 hypothetical protein CAPTEDRAFT_186823 [Capitella teleta]
MERHLTAVLVLVLKLVEIQGKFLYVEVDDTGNVYLDSAFISDGEYFNTPIKYETYGYPKNFAISSKNTLGDCAIIGHYGDRVTNGVDWLCSGESDLDWLTPDFDYSGWTSAVVKGANNDFAEVGYYPDPIPEMPLDAFYIWWEMKANSAVTYCRSTLPEIDYKQFAFAEAAPTMFKPNALHLDLQMTSLVECSVSCGQIGNCLCRRELTATTWTCSTHLPSTMGCCSYHFSSKDGICRMYDAIDPVQEMGSDWVFYAMHP